MTSFFIEFIGFIGAGLLTFSSVPQLYHTFKTKTIQGLSLFMLLIWLVGCFLMLIYILFTTKQLPLIINYGLNVLVIFLNLLLYVKYK